MHARTAADCHPTETATRGHGMTRARLTVSVPAGTWRGDVSRDHPETRLRTVALAGDGDAAVEVLSVAGPGADAALSAIDDHPGVRGATRLGGDTERLRVEVHGERTPLLRAAAAAHVAVETPFDVIAGEATVALASTHAGLSDFGEELRARDIDVAVEYVGESVDPSAALTPAQRELLLTAVEMGYYERPRECTLTDLAGAVGIAKSTCSETLQRVESAVVDAFLRDAHFAADDPDRPSPSDRATETRVGEGAD